MVGHGSRRPAAQPEAHDTRVVYRVAPHAMATVREEDPLDGWPVATMATMATPKRKVEKKNPQGVSAG